MLADYDEFYLIPALVLLAALIAIEISHRLPRRQKPAMLYSSTRFIPEQFFSRNILLSNLCSFLRLTAVLLLIFALIRPQIGLTGNVVSLEGIAINMLIDRSSSMSNKMQYKNQITTRLETVKKVFKTFVLGDGENLNGRPNDLIAVSSFAMFTDENAPLTLDHRTLTGFVDQITPAEEYEDGTMIGDALYQTVLRMISAENHLNENPGRYKIKSRVIILLTDGEQTQGGMSPIKAAQFAKDNGIKIYTIAITSPLRDNIDSFFGNLMSFPAFKIDTSNLERVAEITGGKFARAESGEALQGFYQTIDRLEKSKIEESTVNWKDYFPILVAVALIMILLEQLIRNLLLRKI